MMRTRSNLKYAIKVVVSHVLYYTGFLRLWQAFVMRRKAVVLMYHRVLTIDERRQTGSHPAIVVDTETFDAHMALLKQRFRVLSVEEFAQCFEQKIPFPDSSCLVTFDDGWRDNVTNALPILRRYGLPALVFLPVSYIGDGRLFWPEALTHLLCTVVLEVRRRPETRERFAGLLEPARLAAVLNLVDADPRASIISAVRSIKGRNRSALEDLAGQLARALDIPLNHLKDRTRDGFLSWAEVETMAAGGVRFGGHGVDHYLLTEVPAEVARFEICGARDVIEDRLRETVPTFSYPNGFWAPEVRDEVRAAGYKLAFTTRRGFVSCDDDPFTIRRLNIHEAVTESAPMFLARVVGIL